MPPPTSTLRFPTRINQRARVVAAVAAVVVAVVVVVEAVVVAPVAREGNSFVDGARRTSPQFARDPQ